MKNYIIITESQYTFVDLEVEGSDDFGEVLLSSGADTGPLLCCGDGKGEGGCWHLSRVWVGSIVVKCSSS